MGQAQVQKEMHREQGNSCLEWPDSPGANKGILDTCIYLFLRAFPFSYISIWGLERSICYCCLVVKSCLTLLQPHGL